MILNLGLSLAQPVCGHGPGRGRVTRTVPPSVTVVNFLTSLTRKFTEVDDLDWDDSDHVSQDFIMIFKLRASI